MGLFARHSLARMSEGSLPNSHRKGNYNTSYYLLPRVLSHAYVANFYIRYALEARGQNVL